MPTRSTLVCFRPWQPPIPCPLPCEVNCGQCQCPQQVGPHLTVLASASHGQLCQQSLGKSPGLGQNTTTPRSLLEEEGSPGAGHPVHRRLCPCSFDLGTQGLCELALPCTPSLQTWACPAQRVHRSELLHQEAWLERSLPPKDVSVCVISSLHCSSQGPLRSKGFIRSVTRRKQVTPSACGYFLSEFPGVCPGRADCISPLTPSPMR